MNPAALLVGQPGATIAPDWYVPGYWYTRPGTGSGFSNIGQTNGTLYAEVFPVFGTKPVTFAAWSINCATSGAGEVLRLGVYTMRGMLPDELIAELGAFDLSSTGVKTLNAPITLAPGIYALANVRQGGSTSQIKGAISTTFDPLFGMASNDPATSGVGSGFGGWALTMTGVSGALPRRYVAAAGPPQTSINRVNFQAGSV